MVDRVDPDSLSRELASMRELIDGHANVQRMLDLAADEADRRALQQEKSTLMAWRVSGAFGVLALAAMLVAAGSVATAMRPAPVPKILVVDKADGVVHPLMSLTEFQLSPEESTIRRNVTTFVVAREGYSYEQADTHYYTTAAFLSPQLQGQWAQLWDKENRESPPNKYKKDRRVRIKVGAITVLRNGLGAAIGARASFSRIEQVNDVSDGRPTNWIATISFHWVNQPTNEQDRRINDLGWEVTDYVSDRDLIVGKQGSAEAAPVSSQDSSTSGMALVRPHSNQEVRQ